MIEIKLKFDNWSEAVKLEDCLSTYSLISSFGIDDKDVMFKAAMQMREQLFELMENKND